MEPPHGQESFSARQARSRALEAFRMPLIAPSLDDFALLTKEAWDSLPSPFRRMAGDVVFRIEDFADDETLDLLGIEDPFELTGLYSGVDLTKQSVLDPAKAIPMVFLYRRPILDEWIDCGDLDLGELITHVLVHEIGHHFGLTDEAMHAILESVG
jgi:predicted Zn-dependent protease with MMP-like domain